MASTVTALETSRPSLTFEQLQAQFVSVRERSLQLASPLSAEDACVQSMPDASPAKWHLAHVTWFFETFILERFEADFKAHNPAFRELYNSYYNGIGKQFSRPDRGLITRPSLVEVLAYRAEVDERMLRLFSDGDEELLPLIELGLHHEQQHQELLLMDIKHLLSLNPLNPCYSTDGAPQSESRPHEWRGCEGGLVEIGHRDGRFHFDNEQPAHQVWLQPYEIASTLVTNGDYLAFIEDGGYRKPLLWLADGWQQVNDADWHAPGYWRERDGRWFEFTLHGEVPLDLAAPVCHVSYYEADAYAQWCGARLPSEFEWEAAACDAAVEQAGGTTLHAVTRPGSGPYSGLFDAVWQWTRSAYLPYPGFKPTAGAVGEYNGKFMSNQMTLKGSACITQSGHARASYRNFFYPHQRWAYCGIRLARDIQSS